MTDREERQHVIEVLKQMRLDYEDFWEENDTEEIKAFNYAIASIETDLKYDLLYEETSGQADKQADKPITQNCESCRYYGSRHKVCNYCYKCSLWTEQEPTTKNDLAHNLCGTCINYKCEFQSGIVRTKCAFYMPPTESNCSEIPTGSTTKDYLGVDYLGVDAINRKEFIDWLKNWTLGDATPLIDFVNSMPSATPQEPKTGHWMGDSYGYICSNCEHSLNDLAQSMDYISFSKPKYCPNCGAKMIEPQESEDKE